MISFVKGQFVEINDDTVVIENNGIGYNIRMPLNEELGYIGIGDEVKIFTYLHVREEEMSLYGFFDKEELRVFKLLIGVSGIGPKGALAILSSMSLNELKGAVLANDSKAIAKAPGIGAKTAQRVIIDIKDKLGLDELDEEDLLAVSSLPSDENVSEASLALEALGYTKNEINKALRTIKNIGDLSVEEIIKKALLNFM